MVARRGPGPKGLKKGLKVPKLGGNKEGGGLNQAAPTTHLVQPKTRRGRRLMERRAPKAVSDGIRAMGTERDGRLACMGTPCLAGLGVWR